MIVNLCFLLFYYLLVVAHFIHYFNLSCYNVSSDNSYYLMKNKQLKLKFGVSKLTALVN